MSFVVPVKRHDDVAAAEEVLLSAALSTVAAFRGDAEKALARLTRRDAVEGPSVEPRVTYLFPDADRVDLVVRVPAPVDGKRGVQQKIVSAFLAEMRKRRLAEEEAAKAEKAAEELAAQAKGEADG